MNVSDMYICQAINAWWLLAAVALIGTFSWVVGYASGRSHR